MGRTWIITILATMMLVGCGGPAPARLSESEDSATNTVAVSEATATATAAPDGQTCATGKLTIGDLPSADADLDEALASAAEKATAWQPDARLHRLRLSCAVLEPRFRWQMTYYSDTAQLFFHSDTGELEPAEVEPSDVGTLPTEDFSFVMLRRSLAKAGYADDAVLNPATGVDIRLNTTKLGFGPPDAPKNDVYFHVAIELRGETKDIFVSATSGTVYQYHL
jgi:hypothetical protein